MSLLFQLRLQVQPLKVFPVLHFALDIVLPLKILGCLDALSSILRYKRIAYVSLEDQGFLDLLLELSEVDLPFWRLGR